MLKKFTRILLSAMLIWGVLPIQDMAAQAIPDPESLDISAFLQAGSEDASTLMGQYLNPLFVGFGFGANGGWYNTAKTHKSLGFDLTVTVNAAKAPSSEWLFDFIPTGQDGSPYQNTFLSSGASSGQGETLFGDASSSMGNLQAQINTGETYPGGAPIIVATDFPAPPGIDYSGLSFGSISGEDLRGYVPFVMIQGGIGLIKNTDLKVRYVPKVSTDQGLEFNMFGLGLMHDIKQWIPGLKHIPIDMSILVGYNNIKTTIEIPTGGITGENQAAEFSINTLTYQFLVSKKLSFLTLYGGGGYNQASSNLKVTGTYIIEDQSGVAGVPDLELTDPVDEKFKSDGWKGTLGMRLKFAVITLHADYTFQQYNMFSAGLGVSLR